MILAFQKDPTFPLALDFGVNPYEIKLFAHYPTCYIAYTTNTSMPTWKKLYEDYQSGDGGSYAASMPANETIAAAPAFDSIDADANQISFNFTQRAGISIPYVYARD